MNSEPIKLRIKKEALDRMNDAQAERDKETLREHLAIEEERQNARRAQQEKQLAKRSEKKEFLKRAKDGDRLVENCCADLEAALATNKLRKERKEQLRKARADLRHAEKAVQRAETGYEEVKDANLELKRERLRAAFSEANIAWDGVHKLVTKKERDRSLKKQARTLLAE